MKKTSEHRRDALAWSNDEGEYTPPKTLVERIDSLLEGYTEIPNRSEQNPPKAEPKHGGVTDVEDGTRADYVNYRKTHFSKVKCPRECPYCARAKRRMGEIQESNKETEKLRKILKKANIDFDPDRTRALGTFWTVPVRNKRAARKVQKLLKSAGASEVRIDTSPYEPNEPYVVQVNADL